MLNVSFYGGNNSEYSKLEIEINRVEVHTRGCDWVIIYDETKEINISVDDNDLDEPILEFSYYFADSLDEDEPITEIRFRVTEAIFYKDSDKIKVKVPDEYKEGYKFNVDGILEGVKPSNNIKVIFEPNDSINSSDGDYNLHLVGRAEYD